MPKRTLNTPKTENEQGRVIREYIEGETPEQVEKARDVRTPLRQPSRSRPKKRVLSTQ